MSRSIILETVRRNKPEEQPLPAIPTFDRPELEVVAAFQKNAEKNACRVLELNKGDSIDKLIPRLFPGANQVVNTQNKNTPDFLQPRDLANVDVAILTGKLGVAENGAVWIDESACRHRITPFITQHLVLVLPKSAIVWNMHQAYRAIRIEETGFGLFIAGPSKTADIEQALVIGAQGPKSLTILLI